jgi:CubicO group peptidase (beta-lactamase class C family)
VRQLLTHTSGLPDINVDDYTDRTVAQTRDGALATLSKQPMGFIPGSAYRYNQTNYMLLGMLIAAKCGKPFEEAALEQLFVPLKLSGPAFGDSRTIIKGRATTYTPYRYGTGRPAQLDHLEILNAEMPAIVYPGAGLHISISDFASWLRALLNHELISEEGLATLWTPATLNDGTEYRRPPAPSLWRQYGLGWVIGEHDGHNFVGGTGGIRSAFFVYPNDGLAVIVLTNSQSARPESLVQGVANLYLNSAQ